MNAILVTGGAGFIGSCFVRQWIREESSVAVVLDKLTYAGNLQSLAPVADSPRFVFQEGDIADSTLVAQLLSEHQIECIVHFAAESHVDRSIDGPAAFVETNVVGTFRLLEAARRYWADLEVDSQARFRFLHVSTDEVYGSLGPHGMFVETTPYAPNSPYSASKAASDHFVRAYHVTFGLPTLLTKCSNNYGPYQFPEKLIPLMILNAVEGKPLPVYGDGQNVRDWLHVEDHCRAIRMVLDRASPGEVFNIGGNCELTNLQVVQSICRIVDRLQPPPPRTPTSSLIQHVADRPGHDRRYAVDTTKLKSVIDWEPTIEFESGLEETVNWYLANDEWVRQVQTGEYRRTRLGLGR